VKIRREDVVKKVHKNWVFSHLQGWNMMFERVGTQHREEFFDCAESSVSYHCHISRVFEHRSEMTNPTPSGHSSHLNLFFLII